MNTPFVSIVIPVYNSKTYLDACIRSVLAQDSSDFEVILVDDGSTDGSGKLCDRYAGEYPFFRVVHKPNQGLGEARNTGLDAARGRYLLFLDSDDMLMPDTVSLFRKMVDTEGDFDLVGTAFRFIHSYDGVVTPENGRSSYTVFSDVRELQREFLYRKIRLLDPGTFFNLRWLRGTGVRHERIRYSEDAHFLWQVLSKARRTAFIPHVCYLYFVREGSIMTSSSYGNIAASYPFFRQLQRQLEADGGVDAQVRKYMLPRWCLGIFHSAARLCSYEDYGKLLKVMDADEQIKCLSGFPDFRVKVLRWVYRCGPRAFYIFNRR